ncbi:hypothetical protein BH09MYX1_BH09MYX1_39850 [soil metagenome]
MSSSQFAVAAHALAALVHDGGGAPLDALADDVNIDVDFLRSVMEALVRANLVEAREEGHGGGYHVARPASTITLKDIHDALEPEGASSVTGGRAPMRITLETMFAQAENVGLTHVTLEDLARKAFGARPVPYLDPTSFQARVLEAKRPVLVEFGASWCSPCRALAPVLEELAAKSAGAYDIVKVDIDDSPEVAERYAIRGVPTVIAFRDGAPTKRHTGLTDAETLLALLDG